MAVGFDTPLGGLALEMAYRNEQQRKKAGEQNTYEQSLVNQRLQKYGGDIADYQDVWNRGYGGAQQAAASQASALRDYWVGLPETILALAKEAQASGGGGGGAQPTTAYPILPPTQPLVITPSYTPSPAYRPSPDVLDRPQFRPQTGARVGARRLAPITVRQGR